MVTSEAQKRASAKWNASRDNIMIRPEKELGAKIRDEAHKAGMSIQNYILAVLQEKLK